MRSTVVIVGPTAVGKSGLGLRLAERYSGEIVSADALQAYRGLDVGTAKPTPRDRQRVPHHLIDILEPDQAYSAGEFARRALKLVDEIRGRGHWPMIVGGSGFYLLALLDGLSPIPAVETGVREALRNRLVEEGLTPLRRDLEQLDPVTAARLGPGDTQRTLRALEVALSTGKVLSEWQAVPPADGQTLTATRVGLTLPRALLYDRIAERVRTMIREGWVDEVEDLLRRGFSPELPAFQAIGYRQLAAHLRGETGLEEAVTDTVRTTRRYAKRQLTWFRRDPRITWFSMEDPRQCFAAVSDFLRQRGPGGENGED